MAVGTQHAAPQPPQTKPEPTLSQAVSGFSNHYPCAAARAFAISASLWRKLSIAPGARFSRHASNRLQCSSSWLKKNGVLVAVR
jgi:hypothetical protein